MEEEIQLNVNGEQRSVRADPASPLLFALRNDLELNGPKFGCGLQQCGACMVLMDGEARMSCRLPLAAARGAKVVTLEGLVGSDGRLHPLQQAIVNEQAAQCGYCLNGMVMTGVALLRKRRSPSRAEIKEALSISLCRCGTHSRFIRAVERAAAEATSKEDAV